MKAAIAMKGGMMDVSIDGFLKVNPPKANLKTQYQVEFAKHCRRLSSTPRLNRLVSSIAHQQKAELDLREIVPAFELELSQEDDREVFHPPGGTVDDSGDVSSGAVGEEEQSVATLEEESGHTSEGEVFFSDELLGDKRRKLTKGHQVENQEIRQRILNCDTDTDLPQVDSMPQAISSEIYDVDGSSKLLIKFDNSNFAGGDGLSGEFLEKEAVAVDCCSDNSTEEGRRVAVVQETGVGGEDTGCNPLEKLCQDSLSDANRRKNGNV